MGQEMVGFCLFLINFITPYKKSFNLPLPYHYQITENFKIWIFVEPEQKSKIRQYVPLNEVSARNATIYKLFWRFGSYS